MSQSLPTNENELSMQLPFLVTNWLAHYGGEDSSEEVRRIRRAASNLASAFAEIGAFGQAVQPSLHHTEINSRTSTSMRNVSYADAKRQWSHSCPPSQLEHLVQSATETSALCERIIRPTPNLLLASTEVILERARHPESGRTLQEAVVLEQESNEKVVASALQPPVRLEASLPERTNSTDSNLVQLESKFSQLYKESAQHVHRFLELEKLCRSESQQLHTLQRSLAIQDDVQTDLEQQRNVLQTSDDSNKPIALEELKDAELNSQRVTAQLQRQLSTLEKSYDNHTVDLIKAKEDSYKSFQFVKAMRENFRDPFLMAKDSAFKTNNRILFNLATRERGVDRLNGRGVPRSMGRIFNSATIAESRNALISSRLSHAATINTHLSYPIYCLRFDRTGRYFITGADDYLVKVFRMGEDIAGNNGLDSVTYRYGAVLVCTLRGHAGVINDIDISSDNCFLATASEDGDCRVWGLSDGRPIAILRGHIGGANMVSWSTLTPYRLVTAGADGLARNWDIRDACLKRYGFFVGKRPEYVKRQKSLESGAETGLRFNAQTETNEPHTPISLPPLPVRGEVGQNETSEPVVSLDVPLLPLPPAPNNIAGHQGDINASNNGTEPGAFVANDFLDDGVKLVVKMQHGSSLDDRMAGPGTRSRRAPVRVICVARCPYGGHFATGSDDGICRIWRDDDDPSVEVIDRKHDNAYSFDSKDTSSKRRNVGTGKLLLTLKGHLSAITDLQYSNAGDRILTASQKDGVVRIWSWVKDPCLVESRYPFQIPSSPIDSPGCQTFHILIKLTKPHSTQISNSQQPRRRAQRNSTSISCDVASWTSDDSKVITSQCELAKQSGTDIVPGSQYIFIWDSTSGHCLLGIAGAHSMQCPVLFTHPIDSSIICSAGADGVARLWNITSGKCIFSHMNKVEHGPIEPNERGKIGGFLDGSFNSDGSSLVLTDDNGRVIVFSCNSCYAWPDTPSWMKEQYFSNDYYELFYDTNGYCVERGSERPPHLAPRGVRCSHSGAPFSDRINDAFKQLVGPHPITESVARWRRQRARRMGSIATERSFSQGVNIVSEFNAETTTLITAAGEVVKEKEVIVDKDHAGDTVDITSTAERSPPLRANSRLSSNWRWRDYSDLPDEDGNEEEDLDADDEEFQLNEGRQASSTFVDSDDEDQEELDEEDELALPSRVSNRQHRQRYIDEQSSDEDLLEYMSTNNMPSGPFIADYDSHFFKLSSAVNVGREWLRRVESNSSYSGRKSYTPQVGDVVVYIPRAHYETIVDFPSLTAPWQSWPEEAVWPVVRCRVRNIRYRFPYKAYFRNGKCRSIVAILTLEVNGIPQLSSDRLYPWPKPAFITPAKSHTFEVSMFDSCHTDFVIPVGLYSSRLSKLEDALEQDVSPEIEAFYADDDDIEDPDLKPYPGKVINYSIEEVENPRDPHLLGSGYNCINVLWLDDSTSDEMLVSPWEIGLRGAAESSDIPRPKLSDEEKRRVRKGINVIKALPSIEDTFGKPVNERKYSDYTVRVEIPMDLSFISTRLESDYYASRLSVISDVKLIYENCVKYNGEQENISQAAKNMLETFKNEILTNDERKSLDEFEDYVIANAPRRIGENQNEEVIATDAPSLAQRRARRQVRPPPVLDSLAQPQRVTRSTDHNGSRVQRRTLDRQVRQRNHPRRGSRTSRSVLEQNRPTGVRLDHENRRGRATRSSQQDVLQATRPPGARDRRIQDNTPGIPRSHAFTNYTSNQSERRLRRSTRAVTSEQNNPSSPNRRSSRRSVLRNYSETDEASEADEYKDEGEDSEDESVIESAVHSEASSVPITRSQRTRAARNPPKSTEHLSDSSQESRQPRGNRTTRSSRVNSLAIGDSESEGDAIQTRQHVKRSTSRHFEEDTRESSSFERPRKRRSERRKKDISSESEDISTENESTRSRQSRKRRLQRPTRQGRRAATDEDAGESLKSNPTSVSRRRISARGSPRRASATSLSYQDPSSSEFGSDVSNEFEDDDKMRKGKRTRESRNASRATPEVLPKLKEMKRRKLDNVSLSSSTKEWPDIDMKNITKLTHTVLDQLEALDEDGIFAAPVIEAYPDITKQYKEIIKDPMDFRTIREERIYRYKSIRGLQEDLLLTFQNCVRYNGDDSVYARQAHMMTEQLDAIFRNSCDTLGIIIPRRW